MGKKWAIFDLDNTIADINNRLAIASESGKLDYGRLHDIELIRTDEPMYETIDLMNDLANFNVNIFILSARFDSTLSVTKEWLMFHNVPYDKLVLKSYKDKFIKSDKWKEKQMINFMHEKNLSFSSFILACDDYKKNQYMFESYDIPCLDPFDVTN